MGCDAIVCVQLADADPNASIELDVQADDVPGADDALVTGSAISHSREVVVEETGIAQSPEFQACAPTLIVETVVSSQSLRSETRNPDPTPIPKGLVTPIDRVPSDVIAAALGIDVRTVDADARILGWQESSLCAQTDYDAFFPEKGGTTRDAKKVCKSCPVRLECLEYALANDERFGIWGGLSERERRRLKKRAV